MSLVEEAVLGVLVTAERGGMRAQRFERTDLVTTALVALDEMGLLRFTPSVAEGEDVYLVALTDRGRHVVRWAGRESWED